MPWERTAARPEGALSLEPLLNGQIVDDCLVLAAGGSWTAANARELERLIDGARTAEAGALSLDMREIRALDTYGAWLLERLVRDWQARNLGAEITGVPERYRTLLGGIRYANREALPAPRRENPLVSALAGLGRAVAGVGRGLVPFLDMLGALGAAAVRALARPRTFRFTSFVHHLDRVGLQAVPIILLITFLIGGIIAQQGIFHFRKFGADVYVVDMVGILVLREIGVLIVAIMVAGRSGSSYTAELGSMKMREEIDALQTMGRDPVEVLILPRVLALVIALPLLTFLGSMAALYGGGLVAWLYGGMAPETFIVRLKEAISLTHFKVGMIKAPFMALAIGIVACSEGLRVKGSAESLGLKTTTSVVKSIFLVIVLDGVFAMFFASIDM
jgi:phospholipid/cholesterol/gamma-HCH transport system permease protein